LSARAGSRWAGGRPGASGRPRGSGPDGKVTAEDIRAKVAELAEGVEGKVQAKLPVLRYAAVAGVVAVAVVAFWLGRRSGRERSTVVEIRRA
jgi:hypothetical protein